MKKYTLSLTELYLLGFHGVTRSEREHLKILAGKITKAPEIIKIPSEYFVKRVK